MNLPRSVHVELLFATPIVIEPVAADVDRASAADAVEQLANASGTMGEAETRRWTDEWPAALDPIVAQARAIATRQTTTRAGNAGPTAWSAMILADAADRGGERELPPAYDAFWRAIYVATPDIASDAATAPPGEFAISDPRLPGPMIEMPSLRLRLAGGAEAPLYQPEVTVPARDAQLLVVPGWLRLSYRPNPAAAQPRAIASIALIAPVDWRGDYRNAVA